MPYSTECNYPAQCAFFNTRDNGQGKHNDCVKNRSLCPYMTQFSLTNTGHHLFGVLSIACLKTSLLTVPTTQNTTKCNCIISLAKNMTVLQPNVFLPETHQFVVTNKGQPAFPRANTSKVNCKLLRP